MSLHFLSDQCVPGEISNFLRQVGHRVTYLREVLPVTSPDAVVLKKAQELSAILLSLNGDFADIVAYPPASHRGVIAIQLHNHPEIIPQVLQRLGNFLSENQVPEFFAGKLLIVEAHRIRIRE